jgi:parallel beta-helix repeat protein
MDNDIIDNGGDGIYIEYSENNSITNNTIYDNRDAGILLWYSNNNYITGNIFSYHNDLISSAGIYLRHSSKNTIVGNYISEIWLGIYLGDSDSNIITSNSFYSSGLLVRNSYHNNIDDNLVNGKPLVYLEDVSDVIVTDAGQVVLVNCNNITVENLDLCNASLGVVLWGTYNSTIKGNNCSNYVCGIWLMYSSRNTIESNNILNTWFGVGIYLIYSSDYNIIIGNNISNNYYGIRLENYGGLCCDNNKIYHNNFIDNIQTTHDECDNIWDDGKYGNYWSDYEERYPDAVPKLFKPWMWNTPYEIEGGDNQDNCPLVEQWPNSASIDITRNKAVNRPFLNILQNFLHSHPNLFRLLQKLIQQLGFGL